MTNKRIAGGQPTESRIATPPSSQATIPSRREETLPCPRCGHPMPALKGGSSSICPNCGFKDSCCY
jgi:predicted RNA-binding Zn-ribbon protein involved in translation (DUF1610 family)